MRHPLLALLAFGCPQPEQEPPIPTVSFLSPADGATLAAGEVDVSLLVEDFTLVAHTAAVTPRPPPFPLSLVAQARAHEGEETYEGYAVLRLDDADVATLSETVATVTVEAGAHALEVELFHADGDAFDPPVTAVVGFEAQ